MNGIQYKQQCCQRCQIPIINRGKPGLLAHHSPRIENNRHFCAKCERRDRDLLCYVQTCIKFYKGMITDTEILEIYDNVGRANKMFFDPFRRIREIYKGKEKLNQDDLDGWIQQGEIYRSIDNRLQIQEEISSLIPNQNLTRYL